MQTNFLSASLWLRRSAWFLVIVAFTWGAGWLAAPPLIRDQIEKRATELIGRKVSVGAVEFKPWTLELTIHDLAIASQDGARTQFEFKRFYANAELESLLRLAPVVDALVLDAPRLRLAHLGGGKYDIDDIVARLARRGGSDAPSQPMRFALFNLALTGGALEFEDRPLNKTHTVSGLSLGVPFLSNLESRLNVRVEPRLAFTLNGSHFDSRAQSTPFTADTKTDAQIELRGVDLAPYLGYLPDGLPAQLQKGVVDARLTLAFEQTPSPQVRMSGEVQLRGVKAVDSAGNDLLAFDTLKVVLDELRPLDKRIKLSLVELTAPRVDLARDGAGRLNAAPAREVVAPAPAASQAAAERGGWQAELARLSVRGGVVSWSDAAVAPLARVSAQQVDLAVTGFQWPMAQAAAFEGSLALVDETARAGGPKHARAAAPASLKFSGTATDRRADARVSVVGLPLEIAAPYLAPFLVPVLQGTLRSEFDVAWAAPDLKLAIASLVLGDVALLPRAGEGAAELASVRQITVTQAQVDLARHSVSVGKLAIDQPRLSVLRAPSGRWMFEDWLVPVAAAAPARLPAAPAAVNAIKAIKAPPVPSAGMPAEVPWGLLVSDLALRGGELHFRDEAASRPVVFALTAVQVDAKDLRPDGLKPVPLQVSAGLQPERGGPGRLEYRGSLQWQPLAAQGSVVATQLPVHVFEPYFGGGLNIELLRADAGFRGDVRYADSASGPMVQARGDVVVEDFRASSLAASEGGLQIAEELLNWKALNLRGVELAIAPGAATKVAISETTLGDFFARIIVYPSGRINLQDLVKADPAAQVAASQPPASATPAGVALAQPPALAGPPATGGLAPVITIGPVALVNGKVFFSDRFVKPNYSANLSELTGKLSAFSSLAPQGQPALAELEVRGRAEGTASLEILGKINPLATPLALDIKGIVRDLELPPLSPYSVKYAGHGIERGKLSVDVAYLVLPNGQLTASNKLVLNQLTFGDKVEGAPASLPVKLAVALLADRNGVIDIDLPISGSLNDPEFRLGPIIFKVLVNLVVKAITAPFSLLASALGGGGDELSSVAFAPGSHVLLPQAKAGLDKVARALVERPALKLTVVGTADLEAEREAYKQERLHALLVSEKRRVMLTGGATASEAGATATLTDTEVPTLLKEVYRRADITKPRNLAGMAKELTATEMEVLLLTHISVGDEAMRDLAVQRAVAVKDYLSAQKLPVERLFLGAAKPVANDPKWSPRAELTLAN